MRRELEASRDVLEFAKLSAINDFFKAVERRMEAAVDLELVTLWSTMIGTYRGWNASRRTRPFLCAKSNSVRVSSAVSVLGFSSKTCLPAARAFMVHS